MKKKVVNKYESVLMVKGFFYPYMTFVDVYPNVQAALEGMSSLYKDTLYEERPQIVQIYGIITEDNGYQHEDKDVLFEVSTKEFWGGNKPAITEMSVEETA